MHERATAAFVPHTAAVYAEAISHRGALALDDHLVDFETPGRPVAKKAREMREDRIASDEWFFARLVIHAVWCEECRRAMCVTALPRADQFFDQLA